VLTTAVSDFPLLFRSHDMGWISPADDAQSFANTILQALHQPEHVWIEKGENAKDFVQQHLDVRRLAQELIHFYSLKGVSEVLC
jgi:glycosyltransferase involved in cell wall biosynthesis